MSSYFLWLQDKFFEKDCTVALIVLDPRGPLLEK